MAVAWDAGSLRTERRTPSVRVGPPDASEPVFNQQGEVVNAGGDEVAQAALEVGPASEPTMNALTLGESAAVPSIVKVPYLSRLD